ncbi:hypothetical protein F503_00970 [Ophiostoma piceae UAMH 11346]|uniref:Uncharacterized protein n=1 Tax=Ophiostoma piceae (strain UAMH 11346) TaxID=1262450 RepID=S3C5Y9_OPHP1|nr:hypothetical protein F503_00970 [Ophiostoma piceae UAMH 11346]
MVQDTAMPDRGSGGTAAPDVTGHSMACSYTNCKAPTIGSIPFCMIHLTQLRSSNKQHAAQPQPSWPGPISNNATSATVPSRAVPRPRKLSGTYVMRKSASSAGLRPPSSVSAAPSAVGHSTPGESALPRLWPRLPAENQANPSTEHRLYDDTATHHSGVHPGKWYGPYAFPTPVESPPFSRLSNASKSPNQNHEGDNIQAQRETLRTPRSRSREPDSSTSAVPPQASHREPGSYLPSAQHRVSYIIGRLRGRAQAIGGDQQTPIPSSPHPTSFSLDTYVYNQDASVSPLAPPPNVTISSAADIAAAAAAASAAAALEESYAAAIAATVGPGSSPAAISSPSISSSHNHNHSQNPPSSAYIYAYIDPRVHWTRSRSKEWHADKQAEIKARGGRKANVGMAAQRIAKQKRQPRASEQAAAPGLPSSAPPASAKNVPSVWVGELPSDVLRNKAWTTLMSTFGHDEEKRQKKAKRLAHQYRQRYGV